VSKFYKIKTGMTVNIRTQPLGSSQNLGYLDSGDVVEELQRETKWSRINTAQNSDGSFVKLSDGTFLDGTVGDVWVINVYFVEVTGFPNPPIPEDPIPESETLPDILWIGTDPSNIEKYQRVA